MTLQPPGSVPAAAGPTAPRRRRGPLTLVVVLIVVVAGLGAFYLLTCAQCPPVSSHGSGTVAFAFSPEDRSASPSHESFYTNLSFTVTLPPTGGTCGCGWGGTSPSPRYGTQNFGLRLWNTSTETELPTERAACAGGQNFSACVSAGSAPDWYAVLFDPGSAVMSSFPTASGAGQYNWTSDPGLPATGEQFSLVSSAPIPSGTTLQVYENFPFDGAGTTGATSL